MKRNWDKFIQVAISYARFCSYKEAMPMRMTDARDLSVKLTDDLAMALMKRSGHTFLTSLQMISDAAASRCIDELEGHVERKGIVVTKLSNTRFCPYCGDVITSLNTWRVLGYCEDCGTVIKLEDI